MQQRHGSVHYDDELGAEYQLGELDVGILEGASPELDAILRGGSDAARSRVSSALWDFGGGGGVGSSSVGGNGGFRDMGGMDINDM